MTKSLRGRRWLVLAALVALAGALAFSVAACGGDDEAAPAETEAPPAETEAPPEETEAPPEETEAPPEETTEEPAAPIKIGHLSTCEGPFTVFYGSSVAGSMLALINRGATPADPADPTKGVDGATIAGHPIEIVWGCSDASPEKALEEAKRLVEQEGVQILVGPLSGSEGIAVANYSKEQPDVTFVNGSSAAQDTTLKVQSPNFFRFGTDGAQWMAGLGAYAYNTLGWRKVVTIADDYDFPYTQNAGFVAEFCSLGGEVVQRLWPALGEEDYSSFIAQIPDEGVDGFYLSVTGTGTLAFVKQYEQLKGNLAEKVVAGSVAVDPNVLAEIGDRMIGVVSAGPVSGDSQDPAFLAYLESMKATWPELLAGSLFDVLYYDAMEAVAQGLEAVGGDLSDGGAAFREVLAGLALDLPNGHVMLDANRNAIADNFLFQVVEDANGDGVADQATLQTVSQVDQTFAGAFSADTPTPDRDNPECVAGNPAPWTSGG